MISKNMSLTCILLSLLVGTTVLCFAQETTENGSDELRQLMSKRVEVLRDLMVRYEFAYEKGRVSLDEYLSRKNELLAAELELATNASERITLRKAHLSNLMELEKLIRVGVDNVKFAKVDLLDITADRLQAEIELLREQQP